MNRLWFETNSPFAVFLVIGAIGTGLACVQKLPEVPAALATATITLGVVVAGFTATQRNMLVGMKGLPLFQTLATSGHHQDLILYLKQCVWSSIALVVISVTRFFLNDASLAVVQIWEVIWIGTFAFVIASSIRNERLIFKIIGKFLESQREPPNEEPIRNSPNPFKNNNV